MWLLIENIAAFAENMILVVDLKKCAVKNIDKQIPTFILLRFKQDDKATLGKLIFGNIEYCCTIEPPWNWNIKDDPKTKENEASCIPEGKYLCVKYSGTSYKDVWEITGVPGKTAVLIHNGNFAYQSKSCILVGNKHTEYKGIPMVNDSVNTLNRLKTSIPDQFFLEIKCDSFTNNLCKYVSK